MNNADPQKPKLNLHGFADAAKMLRLIDSARQR